MKTILWAFKDRHYPTPVVHLFTVFDGGAVSPLAGCGMRRRDDSKLHVVTLDDRRFGVDMQLCAHCAKHAKLDPAFNGVEVRTLKDGYSLRWDVPPRGRMK